MAQEINLGGTIYISSKHAASITGYAQDYIGQLARSGSITAQRVSGVWYVLEESLRAYKEKADLFVPKPPPYVGNQNPDVTVSFDGKDYLSANRAAKLTSYHQDYIGQLARTGQILSKQVGKRWYVERESLLKHKEEKDALLAAVQAESVGLAKVSPVQYEKEVAEENQTHFTYLAEENNLVSIDISGKRDINDSPLQLEDNEEQRDQNDFSDEVEEAHAIPIRIINPVGVAHSDEEMVEMSKKSSKLLFLGVPTVSLLLISSFFLFQAGYWSIPGVRIPEFVSKSSVTSAIVGSEGLDREKGLFDRLFSPLEIVYKRSESH